MGRIYIGMNNSPQYAIREESIWRAGRETLFYEEEQFTDWWKQDKRYLTLVKAVLITTSHGNLLSGADGGRGKHRSGVSAFFRNGTMNCFILNRWESIVKYGFPQRYFGFNESHALQLSFAACRSRAGISLDHHAGLVFGWNLLSPVICNIVLLTITMFVFVWLVKPPGSSWASAAFFTVLNTCCPRYAGGHLFAYAESIFTDWLFPICIRRQKGKLTAMFIVSVLLTLMRPYMLLFCYWPAFGSAKPNKSDWIVSALVRWPVQGVVYVC